MGIRGTLTRKAVFLDRDGVLNRAIVRDGSPYPPRTVAELEIPADVPQAVSAFKAAGFELIVVTNQPDVARGKVSREIVEAINDRLMEHLHLDRILTCFHDDRDNCRCRKPKPGFLHQMREELGIDLKQSFMVGDRWRDIEAGRAAGCRTVLIDHGYSERRPHADHVCSSVGAAAKWILSLSHQEEIR